MKTKRKFKTSTIHLYHNPCSKNGKGDCNIFIDGARSIAHHGSTHQRKFLQRTFLCRIIYHPR